MSNKHNARLTTYNGIQFGSLGEARRYQDLALAEKAGEITGLKPHPRFTLQEAFTDSAGTKHRAIVYVADFTYIDLRTGREIVEDFKGYDKNRAWLIKKKLFLYRYRDVDFLITK